MEVYAPLAHRLGMQKIKWELEDTSLQYLDPEGYQEIIDYLKKNEDSANSFMNAIQSKITNRLASVGIHGSIYGRIKHTYSIYRKMRAQNKTTVSYTHLDVYKRQASPPSVFPGRTRCSSA